MKTNLPVTQREKPFPSGKYLVSKTDLKGVITYVNDAFQELSGFSREELIGKSHNLVRHPDMPPQAFEDLWNTVKAGRPWRGTVKNRAKDGDHYWVDAFVVPLRHQDQTVGYMSVRSEPSRTQVADAEALYQRLRQSGAKIDSSGSWLHRLSLKARLVGVMSFMGLLIVIAAILGLTALQVDNRSLRAAYEENMKPSLAVSRMVTLMGDNRSQVMLGLQHSPDSPFLKMHDHPLAMHVDATLNNREAIEAARAEYLKHDITPEEKALADAFFAARDTFSKEGVAPARDALKAGEFQKANVLLLTKINPLYKEVIAKGEALQNHLYRTGEQDYQAAEDRYAWMSTLGIAGTLVSLILVAVATVLLIRAIVLPMRRAVAHFDRISQNVLTDEIDISGRDEAGQLLNGLAAMQVHLKVILDEIRLASASLDQQCRRLHSEMDNVIAHSRDQRDRVQSVAATTEEVTQSAAEVAGSAGRAAEAAVHSRELVGKSTADMSNSMAATGRVVTAVQASSATIGELNQAIEKIGDITNTIKEIADQTNLLALNAAIEAARAGEFGRGFAVVADEVRKLAERTSSSTADINATVVEFRSVTHNAVESMNLAVQEVDAGIGMMRASVGGLDQITASSKEVAAMAEHIASASREQSVASTDVAQHMEQISSLIDQNTSVALEAWNSVEEISRNAEALRTMVSQFQLIRRA
jgi:aerotaxis receptor